MDSIIPLESRVLAKTAGIRTAGMAKTTGIGTAGTAGINKNLESELLEPRLKKLELPMLTRC